MDYGPLIRYHEEKGADMTVCAMHVPLDEASRFGILSTHKEKPGCVSHFEEKPSQPRTNLASMGIYVFDTQVLTRALEQDAQNRHSSHDFGKDILPKMVAEGNQVYCFPYDDYWVDVGTVQAYWEAHMDLLDDNVALDLQDREWVIHTRSEERPPANIRTGASIGHSLISDGCVIKGAVEYSVLSPGVQVKPGATVRNSIVMTDTVIDEMAVIDRAIIDKNVHVGTRAKVGTGQDMHTPNQEDPRLDTGITLIGKNTVIPPGTTIGRNCVIASDVPAHAFHNHTVRSGQTIAGPQNRIPGRAMP
jgi:glucose-1-phosphate adenylyltransferase